MVFKNYHQNVAYTEDLSMDEKSNKVKLLVYATEDDRARIKMAAAKLHMSMSQFMLDSIMEQVSSVEDLEKKGEAL